jgi:excisionase family DNA binding protein
MSSNRTNTGIEPATMTPKQAAVYAGVSLRTLFRWLGRGIVPGVVKRGRVVRIHKQSFDRWLQSGAK